jgi:hypothetical protein
MRKDNTAGTSGERYHRPSETWPIADVLGELLAAYSARFPQFKFVIVGPADSRGPDHIESTSMTRPA